MVKILIVKPLCNEVESKKFEGKFLSEKHFKKIIDEDCDIYALINNKKKLLAKYRVEIIPEKLNDLATECFKKDAKKASSMRGIASGKISKKNFSKNIIGFVSPDSYKSKVIYKDGSISKYYRANPVNSLIVGYFDQPTLKEKHEIVLNNRNLCRTTKFTEQNKEKWKKSLNLIKEVDRLYKKLTPSIYKKQQNICKKVKKYCIDKTVFTTLTVNYNWRTACHVDKGDLKDGYSLMTVSENGNYDGGYLGFPRFGICFDIKDGDLILFDPHHYHCNTKIIPKNKNWSRISIVYYFREGMLNCHK